MGMQSCHGCVEAAFFQERTEVPFDDGRVRLEDFGVLEVGDKGGSGINDVVGKF